MTCNEKLDKNLFHNLETWENEGIEENNGKLKLFFLKIRAFFRFYRIMYIS